MDNKASCMNAFIVAATMIISGCSTRNNHHPVSKLFNMLKGPDTVLEIEAMQKQLQRLGCRNKYDELLRMTGKVDEDTLFATFMLDAANPHQNIKPTRKSVQSAYSDCYETSIRHHERYEKERQQGHFKKYTHKYPPYGSKSDHHHQPTQRHH